MVRAAARSTALLLLLAGCYGTDSLTATSRSDGPVITRDLLASFQTDTLSYYLRAGSLGYEADIGMVFTNHSPATAYVVNCGGGTSLRLERLVGEQWLPMWGPVLASCLSPPIVVQPQTTWLSTIHVFGGYPDCNCQPRFFSDSIAGIYRVVYSDLYNSFNSTAMSYSSQMPFGMRVSNSFVIAVQPR